ncbi:GAP family protein [Haloprofundus halophilus]|uniref:GAP family protein n=1 Tax=Haloprofundus halophilus TaxID=2283527 RepID=UPI000E43A6B0|nr:GAP family protein [Haloprofundus halophilus]
MSLVTVLPLAVVMVAGPQILSAIFLATSEQWRRNSAAFVLGASLSISLVVVVAYLLGSRVSGGGTLLGTGARTVLNVVVLALLVYVAFDTYRTRHVSEPPKWMGTLATATPRFSLKLGFLLLGFFPTDIVTSVTVGTFLAANGAPVTDAAGFVAVTLLLLALPSLSVLALGDRAETALPKIRDWMNDNSWVVSEAVLLLFVVLTLDNLLG